MVITDQSPLPMHTWTLAFGDEAGYVHLWSASVSDDPDAEPVVQEFSHGERSFYLSIF